jgi:FKBP-type peptidyl-prolyl cis-trans isomerase SlyD
LATIKEKDFITIEYTGKLEDGMVFDTTNEDAAKAAGLRNPKAGYGAVVICIGQAQLLEGLDRALIGATVGEHTIILPPESAFGKKSAKLIQLVATSKFKKEGIKPHTGLQVNIDGMLGVIKNVSGGRTLVDFNHPLSGRKISYDVTIKEIITDIARQLEGLVTLSLGNEAKSDFKEGTAIVITRVPLPDSMKAQMKSSINDLIPSIKTVEFKKEETLKPEEK